MLYFTFQESTISINQSLKEKAAATKQQRIEEGERRRAENKKREREEDERREREREEKIRREKERQQEKLKRLSSAESLSSGIECKCSNVFQYKISNSIM